MRMIIFDTVQLRISMAQVLQDHLAFQLLSVELGEGDTLSAACARDAVRGVAEVRFVHSPGGQVRLARFVEQPRRAGF